MRIRTGEIGNVRPMVAPLLQRHSCTNSIVATDKGITLKQQGDKSTKMALLIAAVGDTLQCGVELINQMIKARTQRLPKMGELIAKMAEKEQWSEEVTLKLSYGTENQESLWGLVNGLTFAAHAVEEMPAEQSVMLEEMAGAILFRPALLNKYAMK